jgi:hypothetical protein
MTDHYPTYVLLPEVVRGIVAHTIKAIDPAEHSSWAQFKKLFLFFAWQLNLSPYLTAELPLPDNFSGVAPRVPDSSSQLSDDFDGETILSRTEKKKKHGKGSTSSGGGGSVTPASSTPKSATPTYTFQDASELQKFKEGSMVLYSKLFAACSKDSVYSIANVYGAMDERDPFNAYQALASEYENSTGLSVVVLFFELLTLLIFIAVPDLIAKIERIRKDLSVRQFPIPDVILVVILMKATWSNAVRRALDNEFTKSQMRGKFPNWMNSCRVARFVATNATDFESMELNQEPSKSEASKSETPLDHVARWEAAKAEWNSSPPGLVAKAHRDAASAATRLGLSKLANTAARVSPPVSAAETIEREHRAHYAKWLAEGRDNFGVVDAEFSDDDTFEFQDTDQC